MMLSRLAPVITRGIRVAMSCAVVAVLVVPAAATGGVLRRPAHCHRAEGVTEDGRWQVSVPLLISISRHTSSSIARRAGYFEDRPVTRPRFVPCSVAASVAFAALQAWEDRNGTNGWVGVSLAVATGRPYLGRFYCRGESTDSDSRVETCTHRTHVHTGRIVVRFTIKPTSA